jgi:hypothetical protein
MNVWVAIREAVYAVRFRPWLVQRQTSGGFWETAAGPKGFVRRFASEAAAQRAADARNAEPA